MSPVRASFRSRARVSEHLSITGAKNRELSSPEVPFFNFQYRGEYSAKWDGVVSRISVKRFGRGSQGGKTFEAGAIKGRGKKE